MQWVARLSGNPVAPEPAAKQGYTIERRLHARRPRVDPSTVHQNDRLVVVLKVTEPEAKDARLLLVDPLPAGLEIDNPKLLDADQLAALASAETGGEPSTTEYRDDRFVVAADRSPRAAGLLHVRLHGSCGLARTYVHPPATVEDMYRPERFGRTAYGAVEVAAAK